MEPMTGNIPDAARQVENASESVAEKELVDKIVTTQDFENAATRLPLESSSSASSKRI